MTILPDKRTIICPDDRVFVHPLAEGAADGGDVGDDVEPVQLAAIRPLVIQRQGELLCQEVVGHRQPVQPVVVAGLQLVLAAVVVHLALHEETRVEVGDVDHAAAGLAVATADLQVDLT